LLGGFRASAFPLLCRSNNEPAAGMGRCHAIGSIVRATSRAQARQTAEIPDDFASFPPIARDRRSPDRGSGQTSQRVVNAQEIHLPTLGRWPMRTFDEGPWHQTGCGISNSSVLPVDFGRANTLPRHVPTWHEQNHPIALLIAFNAFQENNNNTSERIDVAIVFLIFRKPERAADCYVDSLRHNVPLGLALFLAC
jgi:hypothetical protein